MPKEMEGLNMQRNPFYHHVQMMNVCDSWRSSLGLSAEVPP
jgi:hypothetical protein